MVNEARRTKKGTETKSETTKEGETYRNPSERKDLKKTTGRNKSKDICERRKTQKVPGQGETIQTKQDIPK